MTENRNHGFNIRFYFGVILLIVAAVLAFFALKKVDVDTLVKDNKFFTHYSARMAINWLSKSHKLQLIL